MTASPWPAPDLSLAAFVAPTATVMGWVTIAEGVSIWPGAVVRGDVEAIELGRNVNIQDGAVLHCDAGVPIVLEDSVTVGHRAVIHSAHVEAGCLIGIGAILLNGVRIGAGSIIGAGAVVTKSVAPRSMVMGVPGKVVRELSASEAEALIGHAARYRQLADRHAGRDQSLEPLDWGH
jgi:carbonic anhydrase/acetyltransferase-like protein (isoleucine patch superfamily)